MSFEDTVSTQNRALSSVVGALNARRGGGNAVFGNFIVDALGTVTVIRENGTTVAIVRE